MKKLFTAIVFPALLLGSFTKGKEPDNNLFVPTPYTLNSGKNYFHYLMSKKDPHDSIFVAHDSIFMGNIPQGLSDISFIGLKIPEKNRMWIENEKRFVISSNFPIIYQNAITDTGSINPKRSRFNNLLYISAITDTGSIDPNSPLRINEESVKKVSASPMKYLLLADSIAWYKKNFEDANNIYKALIQTIPTNDSRINNIYVPLLWRAGYTSLLIGDYKDAFKCFFTANRIIESYLFPGATTPPTGVLWKRFFSIGEGRFYVGNNKEKAYSYICSSLSALLSGDMEKAIKEARTGIKFYHREPLLYQLLGDALYVRGKYDDAIAMYKKAFKINSQFIFYEEILKTGFQEDKGLLSIIVLSGTGPEVQIAGIKKIKKTKSLIATNFRGLSGGLTYVGKKRITEQMGWFGHELLTVAVPVLLGMGAGKLTQNGYIGWGTGLATFLFTNIYFGWSDLAKASLISGALVSDAIVTIGQIFSEEKMEDYETGEYTQKAIKVVSKHELLTGQLNHFHLIPVKVNGYLTQLEPGDYEIILKTKEGVSRYKIVIERKKLTKIVVFEGRKEYE